MTDRPMGLDAAEHPDEGLIHAWLDDALAPAEAERLAAHVQGCAECQARVAEARGLIAGASRIVAALDDVPAGTRPGWAQGVVGGTAAEVRDAGAPGGALPARERSAWRWLRVTPGRAALAATILVALGITLTHEHAAEDSLRSVAATFNPQKADAPAATSAEGAASDAGKEAAVRDELLDSAIKRRVASEQGRPAVEPAPGPSVPLAPSPGTVASAPLGDQAGERVALGRAKVEESRAAPTAAPDRSRTAITGGLAAVPGRGATGAVAGSAAAENAAPVAAGAAPPIRADQPANVAVMSKSTPDAGAVFCLRIASSDADARWGDQPLPLVLRVGPGPAEGVRMAAVLTPAGEPTTTRASWTPRGDSVAIGLRRIGYSGSMVLGPGAPVRSGLAISGAAGLALEEVVVTSQRAEGLDAARAQTRRAAPSAPQAAAAPPQPTPAPAGPPLRRIPVSATQIACPVR